MSFAPDSHRRRRMASPDPLVRSVRSPDHERWLSKAERRQKATERSRATGRSVRRQLALDLVVAYVRATTPTEMSWSDCSTVSLAD